MSSQLDTIRSVVIVGIKGVAMVHIATMLAKMNKRVVGFDVPEQFITDKLLSAHNVPIHHVFDPALIPHDCDLVLYSASHGGVTNPVVATALARGTRVLSQASFLSLLTVGFTRSVAVCGCHGKTTTSALLAYTLIQMGQDPSYLVGSSEFNGHPAGDYRGTGWFVLEADEYGVNPPYDKTPKFHYLSPTSILCTNVDFDHPDVYESLEQVHRAYETFFNKAQQLVLCADDPFLRSVAKARRATQKVLTYGYSSESDYRIVNFETHGQGSQFDLLHGEHMYDNIQTGIFGEKNMLNAAGVFALIHSQGFAPEHITYGMMRFSGPKRRFEVLYESANYTVVDDYAHHPDEIRAVLEAARDRYPARRIIVVFQPHTFSRTASLKHEFADALSGAYMSLVAPIFPSARENPQQYAVSSHDIASHTRARGEKHVIAFDSKQALVDQLAKIVKPRDVIFTMGAGDIYHLSHDIISRIE